MPLLVTALIWAPVKPLLRTSKGATLMLICSTASMEIGCVPAWPPGVPLPARPKTSLSVAPSTWMSL